jgi:hypothetical protein
MIRSELYKILTSLVEDHYKGGVSSFKKDGGKVDDSSFAGIMSPAFLEGTAGRVLIYTPNPEHAKEFKDALATVSASLNVQVHVVHDLAINSVKPVSPEQVYLMVGTLHKVCDEISAKYDMKEMNLSFNDVTWHVSLSPEDKDKAGDEVLSDLRGAIFSRLPSLNRIVIHAGEESYITNNFDSVPLTPEECKGEDSPVEYGMGIGSAQKGNNDMDRIPEDSEDFVPEVSEKTSPAPQTEHVLQDERNPITDDDILNLRIALSQKLDVLDVINQL